MAKLNKLPKKIEIVFKKKNAYITIDNKHTTVVDKKRLSFKIDIYMGCICKPQRKVSSMNEVLKKEDMYCPVCGGNING